MAKFTFERCFERFQAFIMLLFLLAGVSAFQLRTNQLRPSQIEADTDNPDFDARDALDILPKFTDSSTAVVSDGVDTVDLDKARDFASNYGKYSYEEVEHMRNGESNEVLGNMCSAYLIPASVWIRLGFHVGLIVLLFPCIFFFRLFIRSCVHHKRSARRPCQERLSG